MSLMFPHHLLGNKFLGEGKSFVSIIGPHLYADSNNGDKNWDQLSSGENIQQSTFNRRNKKTVKTKTT